MALQTEPQWKEFFQSVGITDDEVSTRYAQSFVGEHITEAALPHLDKATLVELGVTVIGHRTLLLGKIKTDYATTPTQTRAKASVIAKLPTLTSEMTHAHTANFLMIGKFTNNS